PRLSASIARDRASARCSASARQRASLAATSAGSGCASATAGTIRARSDRRDATEPASSTRQASNRYVVHCATETRRTGCPASDMDCAVWTVQNPAIPVPVAGSLHARRTSPYLSPVPPSATLQPPVELPHLGKVLAISSGKGGVGKSTVSANVAVALARAGHRVGLMDADIYGPNIPRMMGVDRKPEVRGGRIQPLEAHGVKLMSL